MGRLSLLSDSAVKIISFGVAADCFSAGSWLALLGGACQFDRDCGFTR
jgi:hypothetical protein